MIEFSESPAGMTAGIVLVVLLVAVALAFIRLVVGPSLPDRVVALELMSSLSVGIIPVYAIATEQRALLDAATVLALVSFLATIAFARYIEQSTMTKKEERR
jgi:multicomponent Na+:H+ antiporter subunit F